MIPRRPSLCWTSRWPSPVPIMVRSVRAIRSGTPRTRTYHSQVLILPVLSPKMIVASTAMAANPKRFLKRVPDSCSRACKAIKP